MICNTTALCHKMNCIFSWKNVEFFNQIIPLKQHFKTFNLEKITRQRGCKIVIIKQEKWSFKAIAMHLRCNIYDFSGQCAWHIATKAYVLKPKSNAFTLKKVKMKWSNHGWKLYFIMCQSYTKTTYIWRICKRMKGCLQIRSK